MQFYPPAWRENANETTEVCEFRLQLRSRGRKQVLQSNLRRNGRRHGNQVSLRARRLYGHRGRWRYAHGRPVTIETAAAVRLLRPAAARRSPMHLANGCRLRV